MLKSVRIAMKLWPLVAIVFINFVGCEGLHGREARRQARGASATGFLSRDFDTDALSDAEAALAAANRSVEIHGGSSEDRGSSDDILADVVSEQELSDKDEDRLDGRAALAKAEDEAEAEEDLEIAEASRKTNTSDSQQESDVVKADTVKEDPPKDAAKKEEKPPAEKKPKVAEQEEGNKAIEESEKELADEDNAEKEMDPDAKDEAPEDKKEKKEQKEEKKDHAEDKKDKRSDDAHPSDDEHHEDVHDEHEEDDHEEDEEEEEEEEDEEAVDAPMAPFAPLYEDADDVAHDVELRHGAEFFPDGTHDDVDMRTNDQHEVDSFFSQDPSVFGNCVLIRDFAEPLRVGSAVVEYDSVLHRDGANASGEMPHARLTTRGDSIDGAATFSAASSSGRKKKKVKGQKHEKLPDDLLLPKGGVVDKDTNDGEFQVNMFAFLRSIAGEVAVIPNGDISKWTSKRRVPIAGYLCTGPNGPVLHTLPTPCLPTALSDDGEAYAPPPLFSQPTEGPKPAPQTTTAAPKEAKLAEKKDSKKQEADEKEKGKKEDASEDADKDGNATDAASDAEGDAAKEPAAEGKDQAADGEAAAAAEDGAKGEADAKPAEETAFLALKSKKRRMRMGRREEPAEDADVEKVVEEAEKSEADAEAKPEDAAAPEEETTTPKPKGKKKKKKHKKKKKQGKAKKGKKTPTTSAAPPSSSPISSSSRLNEQKARTQEMNAPSYPYHVWVGGAKLTFSSKPRADHFCSRLTERIASDIGDTVWDTDDITPEVAKKPDLSLATFARKVRKASPDWTVGTKRLLVVVMDWMVGDKSRAPYSHQTLGPEHYRNRIFPRVREAFQKMSYGKFDLDVTVLPQVIRYTRQRSRYMAEGYPFPGLYNGARESLQGNMRYGRQYNFDEYDLVYVISPQQAPTGTKGVAWVGAKGAMCNGCEEISENFQVMVAVHELGHNLGLSHASSTSLEYGNVFDWMGNYPDVEGLSYGMGYKLKLHWLPAASVAEVTERDLRDLNDEYVIRPFDNEDAPRQGELVGVKIHLKADDRDLYISYRNTVGTKAGVYLVWQDKDKPNSEIVDAACHSPSQQDARLREGWTYMDPSGQVVIYVSSVDDKAAVVRVFRAPGGRESAAIRDRKDFTDGKYKCPRTCQDSDLLVSVYQGCSVLAQDGYCRGGAITMGGKKYNIKTALCPQACDACEDVLSGSAEESGGCADRNVKISGMTCRRAAAAGHCNAGTSIGNVGRDLCPRSCGKCPPRPSLAARGATYSNPKPIRSHGARVGSREEEEEKPQIPPDNGMAEEEEQEKEDEEGSAAQDDEEKKEGEDTCTDDLVWSDADHDGCQVYAQYIKDGKLTKEEACNYNDGAAKVHCRKTCDTCEATSSTCEDKECITSWLKNYGKCYGCQEFANMCKVDSVFRADCPRTCGECIAKKPRTTGAPINMRVERNMIVSSTTTTTTPVMFTAEPRCEDQECVETWLQTKGKCFACSEFAEEFCGRDADFMRSCPRTCKLCLPHEEPPCEDDFKPHVCKRNAFWGWCSRPHIAEHCKATCQMCPGQRSQETHKDDRSKAKVKPQGSVAVRQQGHIGVLALCALAISTLI
eukprot:TRINITY_DN5336_c0_g1_i5.p1 TRINITY_DN5336_c0_g1~~TRINITY_DN5336_c0_g1_i5.p1  ORF type:complete len:1589 (-),score=479.18 TRINITY_DN5336_c0_g1_i5:214-4980(-)